MKERKHHHHSSGSSSSSTSSSSSSKKHHQHSISKGPKQSNQSSASSIATGTTSSSQSPQISSSGGGPRHNSHPLDGIPEIFRAKLFLLNQMTNKWIDVGIGYPKIFQPRNKKNTYYVQFFLEGQRAEVYTENLANDLIIENPKDKQITITNDETEEDIAISFQNDEGRLSLWQQIHIAQAKLTQIKQESERGGGDEMDEEEDLDNGHNNNKSGKPNPNLILPLPTITNLSQFYDIFQTTPVESRIKMVAELRTRQRKMLRGFSEAFRECEKKQCMSELSILVQIFVAFVFIGDMELLQILLNDDNYLLTFGILEYEEETHQHSTSEQRHRQFFEKQAKQIQVVNFKEKSKADEVHFNFRLQYLRDTALAHILDDHTISFLNAASSQLEKSIMQHILTNKEAMTSISNALSERDYSALQAVFEMFSAAKSTPESILYEGHADIFETFEDYLIFDILESFLRYIQKSGSTAAQNAPAASAYAIGSRMKKQVVIDEKQAQNTPMMIARIMTLYMQHKPACLLRFMGSNEQKFQQYSFFQLLCEAMIASKYPVNNLHFSELVRQILTTSAKELEHGVFIEQFVSLQLPKMVTYFVSQQFTEDSNAIRFEFLEILSSIFANLSDIEQLLSENTKKTLCSIPGGLFNIFETDQKCICVQVIRILTLIVQAKPVEMSEDFWGNSLKTIMEYYTKKIRNTRGMIYSEIMILFQTVEANPSPAFTAITEGIKAQYQNNRFYQKLARDLHLQVVYEERKRSDHMSLFDRERVRVNLSTSKQQYHTVLGAEDIDSIETASRQEHSTKLKSSKFSSNSSAMH